MVARLTKAGSAYDHAVTLGSAADYARPRLASTTILAKQGRKADAHVEVLASLFFTHIDLLGRRLFDRLSVAR